MSRPLEFLVLSRFGPQGQAGGGALRNWQNIQALSGLGRVDVVSIGLADSGTASAGVRDWTFFPVRQLAGRRTALSRVLARLWPLRPGLHPAISSYHHAAVVSWLGAQTARRRYDVAVIEEIWLARYVPELRRLRCKVVFDAHNVESVLRAEMTVASTRAGSSSLRNRGRERLLLRRLVREEGRVFGTADQVWACSAVDARTIEATWSTQAPVLVVPNGVNVDAYRRAGAVAASENWPASPLTMVYPGSFSYYPNEEAALCLVREILPRLRARGLAGRVVLVGRDPTPAMLRAANDGADVIVTGMVESILPYLEAPCIVTLPISLGGGTRLKILEAFACGRPVVSSAKGAEGIEAVHERDILLCEGAEAFVNAVIELWQRPQYRARLCANALELVNTSYSWSAVGTRIAAGLTRIIR